MFTYMLSLRKDYFWTRCAALFRCDVRPMLQKENSCPPLFLEQLTKVVEEKLDSLLFVIDLKFLLTTRMPMRTRLRRIVRASMIQVRTAHVFLVPVSSYSSGGASEGSTTGLELSY